MPPRKALRTELIQIKVSPSLAREVRARAAREGLSVSSFLRRAIVLGEIGRSLTTDQREANLLK